MTKKYKKNTIIIIEDDTNNRNFLSRVLSLAGFITYEAENGDIGLELIRQHRTALLLLDLTLSKHHGWSVLEEIKRDPELRTTPVIIITGLAGTENRRKALSMGADAYLVKPISADYLESEVNRILHHNQ